MVLTAMTAIRIAITSSNNSVSVKNIQGTRQSADVCLTGCGLDK